MWKLCRAHIKYQSSTRVSEELSSVETMDLVGAGIVKYFVSEELSSVETN